jgi:hypothetical protein
MLKVEARSRAGARGIGSYRVVPMVNLLGGHKVVSAHTDNNSSSSPTFNTVPVRMPYDYSCRR